MKVIRLILYSSSEHLSIVYIIWDAWVLVPLCVDPQMKIIRFTLQFDLKFQKDFICLLLMLTFNSFVVALWRPRHAKVTLDIYNNPRCYFWLSCYRINYIGVISRKVPLDLQRNLIKYRLVYVPASKKTMIIVRCLITVAYLRFRERAFHIWPLTISQRRPSHVSPCLSYDQGWYFWHDLIPSQITIHHPSPYGVWGSCER